jgi:hypothetical protein
VAYNLQDTFKKMAEGWEWCIRMEMDYFKGDGGQYA